MASIDLSRVSVTQANELIRKYGADGEDIEVINPDARHHIGVGLVHKVKLHIRGSSGYFCAGLTDGPWRHDRTSFPPCNRTASDHSRAGVDQMNSPSF